MKPTNHNLTCSKCGGSAIRYYEDGRIRYYCFNCGDNGFIKNLKKNYGKNNKY